MFFKKTIQRKILTLVVLMIGLSQLSSFLTTFTQFRSSQENSILKSFQRTEVLVKTLFRSKKENLLTQAEMIGSLPVMMAVVNSEDEETILDSAQSYKEQFSLDFVDVIDVEGVHVGSESSMWQEDNLYKILNKMNEGENPSGFVERNSELVFFSAAPIGFPPSHSGYLILGVRVTDKSASEISEIANSDIAFMMSQKSIANTGISSLSYQFNLDGVHMAYEAITKKIAITDFDGNHLADLLVQSSLKESNDLFSKIVVTIVIMSFLIIFIFGVIAAKVSQGISSPIKNLHNVATKITDKMDFSLRAESEGADEVASLSQSFNTLLDEISDSHEKLEQYSKGLEIKVEERTKAINTILNNVTSGFCIIDKDLRIQEGFTKSCLSLVGDQFKEGEIISNVLFANQRESEHFEYCYKEVFEDFMPESVTLGQAPKKTHIQDRIIGLHASVIRDEKNEIISILLNMSDISDLEAAEQENKTNRSLLKILSKRNDFVQFILETRNMLNEALEICPDENMINRLKIILHTIKGNCGVVGLMEQAALIHHVEDKDVIVVSDIHDIHHSFESFLNDHIGVLGLRYNDVQKPDLLLKHYLLDDLKKKFSDVIEYDQHIASWVDKAQQKPAGDIFAPMHDLVQRVADRVYKAVNFKVEGEDVLINPDRIKPLVSVMPHIFRNCLDHGLEAASDRGNKDEKGLLQLVIQDEPSEWLIVIQDDGRGIATEKLVKKALENGSLSQAEVDAMSHEEKLYLIFADGVSTAEEVSDVSGRGVGMAAVLETVKSMGGDIRLASTLGQGTSFTFRIPKQIHVS